MSKVLNYTTNSGQPLVAEWTLGGPLLCRGSLRHTSLEGVKISLQFPNNELWWVSKSTFQGLKKYVFQKN